MNKFLLLLWLFLPLTGFAQTAVKSGVSASAAVTPAVKKEVVPKATENEVSQIENGNRSWLETIGSLFPEKITDWLLVLFNFLLFVATSGMFWLGWRQEKALRQSISVAEESVKIAQQSAEIIPTIERPYVFLESVVIKTDKSDDVLDLFDLVTSNQQEVTVEFTLRNHGRTPAIITKLSAELKLYLSNAILDTVRGVIEATGVAIGASGSVAYQCALAMHNADFDSFTTIGGAHALWFCGSVEYIDFQKKNRTTIFCWKFDPLAKEFRISTDQNHNRWT
jgi:hypothetical protein